MTARIQGVKIEMPNDRAMKGKFCVHFSAQELRDAIASNP